MSETLDAFRLRRRQSSDDRMPAKTRSAIIRLNEPISTDIETDSDMNGKTPDTPEQEYDADLITLLEAVWGRGFMSPGGSGEVDRIVHGIDLSAMKILDIGCGVGGADVHLAKCYAPTIVIGVDVEADLISRCQNLAAAEQVTASVDFRLVSPGPLPIEEGSIDLVFSKDSIIHIEDKASLAKDVRRVLKPGGWFAASDWLAGYTDQPSQEMLDYVQAEGLDFGLANAQTYTAALEQAGFEDISLDDRNAWYQREARVERDNLKGALFDGLLSAVGQKFLTHQIGVWDKMIVALDQGQLRPTHLRARSPSGC